MIPRPRREVSRSGVFSRCRDVARAAFYRTIKYLAWPLTRLYVRMQVEGLSGIPRVGPCIVVANHMSYVDPVVLGSAFPRRIHFLISRPIYRLLRIRWLFYMMGTIPVSRGSADPAALKRALRILRQGGVIGIFPEGRRVGESEVGTVQAGVGFLAARSGATVIPATIEGAGAVMPVGAIFPKPHPIRILFSKPRRFAAQEVRRPDRNDLKAFACQVMQIVQGRAEEGASPVRMNGVCVRKAKK